MNSRRVKRNAFISVYINNDIIHIYSHAYHWNLRIDRRYGSDSTILVENTVLVNTDKLFEAVKEFEDIMCSYSKNLSRKCFPKFISIFTIGEPE